MNHPEINSDEAIDRVLSGLRNVEPPLGMESRILSGATESAKVRRSWRVSPLFGSVRSWTLVAATVAIAVVASGWMMLRSHRNERRSATVSRHDSPVATSSQQIAVAEAMPVQSPSGRHVRMTRLDRGAPVLKEEPPRLTDEDAQAISDLHAPSHPAPPMPLTEQEKFLLQMRHRGDPIELAMLDPKMRSSVLADSKAEFERFFAEPAPSKINQPTPDVEPSAKSDVGPAAKPDVVPVTMNYK